MSVQDEMDHTIAELERQVDHLKALRAQQIMQLASPRVVAGPFRVREDRVLTHAACASPCGPCMDDPPEAA